VARAGALVLGALLGGSALVAVGLGAGAQEEPPELGSFALVATAPGFEMTEDEPSAQAHPEGHGAVPETSTLLANGGVGYGLATIAWPGATVANAGAVGGLLIPSHLGPAPVPDAVSQLARGAAPAANYPIRAEARAGSDPDASYNQIPEVTITAHADASRVTGSASMQRVLQPDVATYGNVQSSSESTLSGTVGRAVASSSVNDVDLGGVVKIKSVTSTATGETDGVSANGVGGTVVQGMTIGGQSAYVDDRGVHIGEEGQPANATANEVANQALESFGMKVYVSQPRLERSGGTATYDAGSLFFIWVPPENDAGNVFTITFGGARVSVAATQGAPDFSLVSDEELEAPDTGGGDMIPSADVAAFNAGGSVAPAVPGVSSPGVGATQPAGFQLAKTFGGLGWGWLLAAAFFVGLLSAGSRRLMADLLDRPADNCPLEGDL
jgi:hypothetical protein